MTEQRYQWAVSTFVGLFEHGEDEVSARRAAEQAGGELLRRPLSEWEHVESFTEDDDDDDDARRQNV